MMDLKQLSNMDDDKLRSYIVDNRKELKNETGSYKCLWSEVEHKGDLHSKMSNYNRHIVTCKHRADHQSVFIEPSDQEFRYPVMDEEDFRTYRLKNMDFCYEFQYHRLGDRGWRTYVNHLELLLIDFFTKYCNMGKVGYKQSVLFNGSIWKYKINKESPYIKCNSKEMFDYFVKEFKTIVDENKDKLRDGGAIEFWTYKTTGKRTRGQSTRMAEEERIRNSVCPPTIIDSYKLGPKGQIIFT